MGLATDGGRGFLGSRSKEARKALANSSSARLLSVSGLCPSI